jgi:hypothetical protein
MIYYSYRFRWYGINALRRILVTLDKFESQLGPKVQTRRSIDIEVNWGCSPPGRLSGVVCEYQPSFVSEVFKQATDGT